jgi:hypothetical protein
LREAALRADPKERSKRAFACLLLWHEAQVPERNGYCRSWTSTGRAIRLPATAALDPSATPNLINASLS